MSTVAKPSVASKPRLCPSCRTGHLADAQRERVFHPRGQSLVVPLLTSVCKRCGAQATSATQHSENLRRLAARKGQYGGLLMGEEILALRRRFGLTQQVASRIFGKGKIAFSRYESETTYPDESTTRLLSMAIAKPDTLKWLADQAGVDIPLWGERCEDEQRVKVRPLAEVFGAAQGAVRHRARYMTPGTAANLGGNYSKIWSARLVSTRQTHTLPEASNDGRVIQHALAS